MKKFLLAVALLLGAGLSVRNADAQAIQITTQMRASAATTGSGIAIPTTYYHQVIWTVVGPVTACSFTIDSSADNSSWSSGGIIPAQICTSGGSSAIVNSVANYARINLGTFTGGGSIFISYTGYSTGANGSVLSGNGAPSGTCVNGSLYTNISTGVLYSCDAGTWAVAGSGGSPTGAAGGALTGTYPNPGVSGSAVATAINPTVLYAQNYSGVNVGAKIQACNTAAIALAATGSGATCDDSALGAASGVTQTITAELDLGDTSGNSYNIQHIFPNNATWIVTITAGTGCAVKQFTASTMTAATGAAGAVEMKIVTQSSTNVPYLYCTNQAAGFNNYAKASNVEFQNNSAGATITAAADFEDIVDESYFSGMFLINYYGQAAIINNVCCGVAFEHMTIDGGVGGPSLTIGGASGYVQAVTLKDSTLNGGGTGYPCLVITGSVYGVTIINPYCEGNGATDTTTAMVTIASTVYGVNIIGGDLFQNCGSFCAGKYAIQTATQYPIGFYGVTIGNGAFVNDTNSGYALAGAGDHVANPPYIMNGNFASTYIGYLKSLGFNSNSANIGNLNVTNQFQLVSGPAISSARGTGNFILTGTGSFTTGNLVTTDSNDNLLDSGIAVSCAPVASTTAVTSSNPTINTDQALIQLSIPAGCLNVLSRPLNIDGSGIYSSTTASSPALTIKAKLCTVSACASGTVVPLFSITTAALNTTALANATWNLSGICVTNATGSTGNLVCHGAPGLTLDTGSALTSPDTVYADTNTATLANIDLTAALFLQFTVAQSVVGTSNAYTQQMSSVR